MDPSLILQNLVSPPVLFFFLGVTAVLVGSDLEIPAPIPKLFSLYLLLAIGFKGGLELEHSGLGGQVLPTIAAAMAMSLFCASPSRISWSRTGSLNWFHHVVSAVAAAAAVSCAKAAGAVTAGRS